MEKPSSIEARSFQFSRQILGLLRRFKEPTYYSPIIRQVLRSSTSVGANITEGQGSSSRREFVRYYAIARRSAYETRYWLRLLSAEFPTIPEFPTLIDECEQITKILTAIILKMKDSNQ